MPYLEKTKIQEEFKSSNPDIEVFKKIRFGETTLKKKIKEYGTLYNFLNSNPIYMLNYIRNKKLVLDANIPSHIEVDILNQYSNSPTEFNLQALSKYFNYYDIPTCLQWFEQLALGDSKVVEMNKYNLNFDKLVF